MAGTRVIVTLTEDEIALVRELLLDERDNAEDNAREADNSEVMLFHGRMETCDAVLLKLETPQPEDR